MVARSAIPLNWAARAYVAGRRGGPAQHAILAIGAGVQREPARVPDHADRLDRRLAAVVGNVGLQPRPAIPHRDARQASAATDKMDRPLSSITTRRVVQRADQGQASPRRGETGARPRFRSTVPTSPRRDGSGRGESSRRFRGRIARPFSANGCSSQPAKLSS